MKSGSFDEFCGASSEEDCGEKYPRVSLECREPKIEALPHALITIA